MDTLACILSCDGLSGIPQTSDGADTPTTVNASKLGKPATGTVQVGDRKELINRDVPETNPSKVSVSASRTIENPSDQTIPNAPIGRHIKKFAVGWTFPEMGWIKANVDGSVKDDLHATCAGVFRDSKGSWCFGFARNLGPNLSR